MKQAQLPSEGNVRRLGSSLLGILKKGELFAFVYRAEHNRKAVQAKNSRTLLQYRRPSNDPGISPSYAPCATSPNELSARQQSGCERRETTSGCCGLQGRR